MALYYKLIVSVLCLIASGAAAQNLTTKSKLPYGAVINKCTVPGEVALTFDDGPFIYTEKLLDILEGNGVRATFFINGAAVGNIQDFAGSVQRAIAGGHQIASHT